MRVKSKTINFIRPSKPNPWADRWWEGFNWREPGPHHPPNASVGDAYINTTDDLVYSYSKGVGWAAMAHASQIPKDDLDQVAEIIHKELGDEEVRKALSG